MEDTIGQSTVGAYITRAPVDLKKDLSGGVLLMNGLVMPARSGESVWVVGDYHTVVGGFGKGRWLLEGPARE